MLAGCSATPSGGISTRWFVEATGFSILDVELVKMRWHLVVAGAQVLAVDASPSMVGIARAKGIDARVLEIDSIDAFAVVFDMILSNFGALNCVRDLIGATPGAGSSSSVPGDISQSASWADFVCGNSCITRSAGN